MSVYQGEYLTCAGGVTVVHLEYMKDAEYYKKVLFEEKTKLEQALNELGVRNAQDTDNWDVAVPVSDVMVSDENELADQAEEAHIDSIVKDELDARYRLVCHALDRIDKGTYGICEVGGEQIEEERINANPAARTCKTHLREEDSLVL